MALKTVEAKIDVVKAAKERIQNILNSGVETILSISGGKDSICMAHLTYTLLKEGVGDPANITVQFVDEEAMFDDVIDIVKDWRLKFLELGCPFEWYCVEVKHYNCLNSLSDEETFILWDRYKKDVWVRPMPKFKVITDDKYLIPRKDNYQSFLTRKNKGKIVLQGLRIQESIQRRKNIAKMFSNKANDGGLTVNGFFFPIYDWEDTDIWRYIYENSLDFPNTYLNLYQIGTARNGMRISQFFSIDTARSLVALNEFDNSLMERIIAREPNAYLATIYYDTEMFRRIGGAEKKDREDQDFRKLTIELLKDDTKFDSVEKQRIRKKFLSLVARHGMIITDKHWRAIYKAIIGGDPKDRSYRGIVTGLFSAYSKASK